MLENQIKSLNEAVIANTAMLEKLLAALTSTGVKPQVKAAPEPKAVKAKPEPKATKAKPAIEPEPETANTVTANDLKGLAKDAIAGGVLRTEIKKLITDAGADTISALDDDQRVEVFNKLSKLRGE